MDLQLFFFALNRVAALLNVLCCHRARTACPRWAQSVSVLPPLHWGLQAECWPLWLLFYFFWLILLVSSAAGENTANSQKPFFLTASTLVPFSLMVFLLFCLTCFCCSQQGLFVILMSSLCSLIFLSIPCATFFYLSWEIHRHLLKFSSFFSLWTGWSLSFALIITNHSCLLMYSFNSAKSVVSFSFFCEARRKRLQKVCLHNYFLKSIRLSSTVSSPLFSQKAFLIICAGSLYVSC